jgi:UDP-N-acetylglucosamine transferase subunit ALG13
VTAPARRVLVLVGTDHHPFDRLVTWVDAWATAHPEASVVVQYGRSQEPQVAEGHPFLEREQMLAAISEADVVVCHGGPATISEARAAGHLPVVVPRNPAYGEHVDDHQMRFSSWLAAKGMVVLCTEPDDLAAALDSAPSRTDGEGMDQRARETVTRFGRMVEEAMARRSLRDGPVVLYLAGFGRSGSTLLERLLGETPGVMALGEVVHLWERGVLLDQTCGCGEPFSRCPFWTEVGQRAFGGWDADQARHVLALRAGVDRKRRIPATALPTPPPATRRALAEYASAFAEVYRAAAAASGAEVVVDSSKHVSLAFALSHDADLDLRVLHLVRDPRAVAHSWAKEVDRPEVRDGEALMPRYSTATSIQRWTTTNLLVESLRARGRPQTRLRYEDLVRDPAEALTRAASDLGLPLRPSVTLRDHVVELGTSHSVAGNPMRFTTGPVTLRVDEAWRQDMPEGPKRAVSLLTAPLRGWYDRSRR